MTRRRPRLLWAVAMTTMMTLMSTRELKKRTNMVWAFQFPMSHLHSSISDRLCGSQTKPIISCPNSVRFLSNDPANEFDEEDFALFDEAEKMAQIEEAKGDSGESDDSGDSSDSNKSNPRRLRTSGITLGDALPPMTPEELEELVAKVESEFSDVTKQQIEDLERLRVQLKNQAAQDAKKFVEKSIQRTDVMKSMMMGRIDQRAQKFLDETEESRRSTRAAAAADRGMAGKGLTMGSWGTDASGKEVVMDLGPLPITGQLGSISNMLSQPKEVSGADSKATTTHRVMVILDVDKDAKLSLVLDKFAEILTPYFPAKDKVVVDRVDASSTIPLGARDAQCVILVGSSPAVVSSAKSIIDRLLTRTVQSGGGVGSPPTHILCLSSLGTERTNKLPFSMQNLFSGKLDKLRQVEDTIISIVKSGKYTTPSSSLDYTIVKWGDIETSMPPNKEIPLQVMPGDDLEGSISVDVAASLLAHAVALQPYARNTTLSAIGTTSTPLPMDDSQWDDLFLRLDGPELLRLDRLMTRVPAADNEQDEDTNKLTQSMFEDLSEFLSEWSTKFEGEARGTGLTTPVTVERYKKPLIGLEAEGVAIRYGIEIKFLPTNTGKNYRSASEEREIEQQNRERAGGKKPRSPSSAPAPALPKKRKLSNEGGVEAVAEITTQGDLRIRARRCNMDDSTVIKEMSEEAILERLREGVKGWIRSKTS